MTFIGDDQTERPDGDVDLFRIFVDFLISEAEDGVSVEKARAVYLAIKSISIAVSAVMAVLSVGSRSGAQNGECSPGSTVPRYEPSSRRHRRSSGDGPFQKQHSKNSLTFVGNGTT